MQKDDAMTFFIRKTMVKGKEARKKELRENKALAGIAVGGVPQVRKKMTVEVTESSHSQKHSLHDSHGVPNSVRNKKRKRNKNFKVVNNCDKTFKRSLSIRSSIPALTA